MDGVTEKNGVRASRPCTPDNLTAMQSVYNFSPAMAPKRSMLVIRPRSASLDRRNVGAADYFSSRLQSLDVQVLPHGSTRIAASHPESVDDLSVASQSGNQFTTAPTSISESQAAGNND